MPYLYLEVGNVTRMKHAENEHNAKADDVFEVPVLLCRVIGSKSFIFLKRKTRITELKNIKPCKGNGRPLQDFRLRMSCNIDGASRSL